MHLEVKNRCMRKAEFSARSLLHFEANRACRLLNEEEFLQYLITIYNELGIGFSTNACPFRLCL